MDPGGAIRANLRIPLRQPFSRSHPPFQPPRRASSAVREWLVDEFREYLGIAREWQAEFQRNRNRYGERIRCRRGCSDCCSQLFPITEVEGAYISKGVKALPEGERQALRARARVYMRERASLLASRDVPDAWGALPPAGLRLPCPALVDGVCSIYEHRPLICRRYGIPLYNPQKPGQIFACELNFQPGEEITDPGLVQIHTGLYDRWRSLQAGFNERGGRRDPEPVTVARAILEDFEEYLPASEVNSE